MTRIAPILSDEQLRRLPSQAEARVYQRCAAGIGDRRMVVFSMPWIRVSPYGTVRDGETDFTVFDEDRGILVIEVKGGGVHCDMATGDWHSLDGSGVQHLIKDPFRQATAEKYALRGFLEQDGKWSGLRIKPTLGHAVMFPDLDTNDYLRGPDRPSEIMGWRSDVADMGAWLDGVLEFWSQKRRAGIGASGIAVIKRLFFSDIEVKPLLSSVIEKEEKERIRLTDEQARVLRALGRQRRVVVSGGAGTGKTLLALEKARALSREGHRTLLLCYNRPLAMHLAACCQDIDQLEVTSFHQLCERIVRLGLDQSGIDLLEDAANTYPGMNRFDVHYPHALAMATEIIEERYDAIVVDEAQDFGQEYWMPVELLLRDAEQSILFIFYDHNQALYTRVSTFPITGEPFLLTRNCRNTRFIHNAAYTYYRGEETEPPPIEGAKIESVEASSRGSQAKRLHALVVSLIKEEKISAESIAVLVPSRDHLGFYSLLEGRPLPRPCGWAIEGYGIPDGVRVDTWRRFKGLEASIVVLWGADELDSAHSG